MTTLIQTRPSWNRTSKSVVEALVLSTVITSLLIFAQITWYDPTINWLETASVFASFGATWLCTRQVRLNYAFGVAATLMLSVVFYQANLLGSMILNMYLVPTVVYGYFIWGKDSQTRPVEHVKPKNALIYLAVTAITWAGAVLLIKAFNGTLSTLDGWLLIGSILAQFLLDRKKIETWIIWALVNVISVYVYMSAGLYLLAGQFAFFLANSFFAWFAWRKTMIHGFRER